MKIEFRIPALIGAILAITTAHAIAQEDMTLRFRALDPEGNPVADAQVTWVPYQESVRITLPEAHEQSRTDSDGYCTVDFGQHPEAAGNNFEVRIETDPAHAGGLRVYPKRDYPDPLTITIEKQVPYRGTVRAPNGKPIAGALLGARWFPRTVTDEEGHFTLWGKGNGASTLSVYHENYAWTTVHAPSAKMEIILQPGYPVTLEAVDSSGNPLPGTRISSSPMTDQEADAAGRVTLLPRARGEEFGVFAAYNNGDTHLVYTSNRFEVSGESPQVIRLVLTPRPPSDHETVSVSGRVVLAESGEPVRARLFVADTLHDFDYFARDRVTTDGDGKFTFEVSRKQVLYVLARPTRSTLYGTDGVVKVDCTGGSVVDLVLSAAPGGAISGRVTLSDDSEPEPQWVTLRHGDQFYQHYSKKGQFQFFNLPPSPQHAKLSVGEQSMDITLKEPGTAVRGVSIEQIAVPDKARIEGVIVDPTGAPQPGLAVNVHIDTGEQRPAYARGETDGEGRFLIRTDDNGTGTFGEIHVYQQFVSGNLTERRGVACTVVEQPEPFPVRGGESTGELRIVVELPTVEYLAGTVRDDTGKPLSPQIEILHADGRTRSHHGRVQDGSFMFQSLPEEPFAIEFTLPGHQARVLQVDRDFRRGDRNVQVVLPAAPFPDDQPIWTIVTGAPWTQESVDASVQGETIRQRFDQYRHSAATPVQEQTRPTTPTPPQVVPVHVVDQHGVPISRIVICRAERMDRYPIPTPATPNPLRVVPAHGEATQILSDSGGDYDVPPYFLLWAEGTGRQYVGPVPTEAPPGRTTITLRPQKRLTLRLQDRDGRPAQGFRIVPLDEVHTVNTRHQRQPWRTDTNGEFVFDWLPPGPYDFAAIHPQGTQDDWWAFRAVLSEGDDVATTAEVGPYPKGSGGALLDELRETWRPQRNAKPLADLWDEQPAAKRRKMKNGLAEQLAAPLLSAPRTLSFLAGVAAAAELHDAVSDLKRQYLTRPKLFQGYDDTEIPNAIAALEGDGAIPFLLESSQRPDWNHRDRLACIVALNRIGTPASLAAWKTLRDEARALPDAPQAQEDYTHRERMTEALALMHAYVTGHAPATGAPGRSAQVDSAYQTGKTYFGNTEYTLHRYGDEWVPVEIGATVMP